MEAVFRKAGKRFREWLGSEEAYSYCRNIARSVFRESFRRSPVATVFPYPVSSNLSGEMSQELLDDITHDFLAFLLDTCAGLLETQPGMAQDVLTGRLHHVVRDGWHRFSGQWREKARSKEDNPRGYLYRRAREVLGQHADFRTRKHKAGWIAYAPAAAIPETNEYWAGDGCAYSDWPPADMEKGAVPEKEIFTAEFLAPAAMNFHTRACETLGRKCWVPVRELVAFLAVHSPWLNVPVETPLTSDDGPDAIIMNSDREDMESRLDRISRLSSVATLAGQLVTAFSPEECRVFVLKFDQPSLTYREMGEQLGYLDHNRAYRIYGRTKTRIKRFCAEWPGPPPEELADDVQQFFLQAVRDACKKRTACP
jgi:hypothetical protein